MKVFTTVEDLILYLKKSNFKSLGLVPTMGALHQGHLSLLRKCKEDNNTSIVSIFVNPLQFNNFNDFEKYPRDNKKDIELLENEGCDILFLPEQKNILANIEDVDLDLKNLGTQLEAEKRPGHFDGVVKIVNHLFNIIKPDKAYFGLKDFQQVCVIKKLVDEKKLPVEIVALPTVRDENNLALSSRNQRLDKDELLKASKVSQKLINLKNELPFDVENKKKEFNDFLRSLNLKIDYFEVVDYKYFKSVKRAETNLKCVACIAYFVGDVRLIDNVFLFD